MPVLFKNIETNISETDTAVPFETSTFNSKNVDLLPDKLTLDGVYKFKPTMFTNNSLRFNTHGMANYFVESNGYNFGLFGGSRLGKTIDSGNCVGALLFNDISEDEKDVLYGNIPESEKHQTKTFWGALSRIWVSLKDSNREEWETFWDALSACGFYMNGRGVQFIKTIDPRESDIDLIEYFLDMEVGPLHSIPLKLVPELQRDSHIVSPISVKLMNPIVENEVVIRKDRLVIDASSYHMMRNIAIDNYIVIIPDNRLKETRFLKISNLLSSEEFEDKNESAEYSNMDGIYGVYGAIKIENVTSTSIKNTKFLFTKGTLNDGTISVTKYDIATDGVEGYLIEVNDNAGVEQTVLDVVTTLNSSQAIISELHFGLYSNGDLIIPTSSSSSIQDGISLGDMNKYNPIIKSNGRHIPPVGYTWKCNEYSTTCDESIEGSGEYYVDRNDNTYEIEVNGSLLYYDDEIVRFYITTGRAYNIDKRVISIPSIQYGIDNKSMYYLNRDYTFFNNVIEFGYDIFEEDKIEFDATLYSNTSTVINEYLFSMYGSLVDINDWEAFNFNNSTAKAAINGLLTSLQSSSEVKSYNRALNIYYGIDVAPEDCRVKGLYESYGYKILNKDETANTIMIEKADGVRLSDLFTPGGKIINESGDEVDIVNVNRDSGILTLTYSNKMLIGSKIFVRLQNKMNIFSYKKGETLSDGTVIPDVIKVNAFAGAGQMKHVVDTYYKMFGDKKYPEIVVYGTDENDGIYNIVNVNDVQGNYGEVELTVYNKDINKDIPFNDYMEMSNDSVEKGYVHFEWPTHKFLLEWVKGSERYHVSYIDAPLDTIYDEDDNLAQYDIICRNISVLSNDDFPGWSRYGKFRVNNGIDEESELIEVTSAMSGIEYGTYFPVDVK